MVPSILPKNEHWDSFQYIKLSQRSFYGRIEGTKNCFRELLTFRIHYSKVVWFADHKSPFVQIAFNAMCKALTIELCSTGEESD